MEALTRRCTARNRAGERCGRAPIPGGKVCVVHGGGAPQVRREAQLRLLAMTEPALAVVLRFLQAREPCPACGRSDADRDPSALRAAIAVLDRTGNGPSATVRLQRAEDADLARLSWAELAERCELMASVARERADEERALVDFDGVVIDVPTDEQ